MIYTLMQICDPNMNLGDYLTNFEFIKAPTCEFADPLGWLVLGLGVYGAISLGIYIRTGTLTIPAVLLLLIGGAILSQVAAIAAPIVVLVLLVVPAGLIALAYYLYSR